MHTKHISIWHWTTNANILQINKKNSRNKNETCLTSRILWFQESAKRKLQIKYKKIFLVREETSDFWLIWLRDSCKCLLLFVDNLSCHLKDTFWYFNQSFQQTWEYLLNLSNERKRHQESTKHQISKNFAFLFLQTFLNSKS